MSKLCNYSKTYLISPTFLRQKYCRYLYIKVKHSVSAIFCQLLPKEDEQV